jgi:hypothetical protein
MKWTNICILFHHISQFLEVVFLNPNKNNIYFSAIEVVPTIDVHTTQDKNQSQVLVQEAK